MGDVYELVEIMDSLRRSGWLIDDTAFAAVDGSLVWVVSGTNGSENRIRAEGPTKFVAWREAARQAREVGMAGFVARDGVGLGNLTVSDTEFQIVSSRAKLYKI